jgi:hypothetical protein
LKILAIWDRLSRSGLPFQVRGEVWALYTDAASGTGIPDAPADLRAAAGNAAAQSLTNFDRRSRSGWRSAAGAGYGAGRAMTGQLELEFCEGN